MYPINTHQVAEPDAAIITAYTPIQKAGAALSVTLKQQRKANARLLRGKTSFKAIPESVYFELANLGRAKYRAIVVATFMAHFWDGWKSRKRTKRKPSSDVMMTRRLLATHFDMPEATGKRAIQDLDRIGIIIVSKKAVFSGKSGKNLGTMYRLPWMEKPSGKRLKIYWGLLVSDAFLAQSVTLQGVIILLHTLHNRSKNRLTIRPYALSRYGIHRTMLPAYITELTEAGFLEITDEYDFAFSWIDRDGKPDFNRLKKISV